MIVARDPASEARLGAGTWDRAVLARVVTGLARAGAVTIGIDTPPGRPSAPGRGGAASDALLSEASARTGVVVVPIVLEIAGDRGPEPGPGHRDLPAIVHRSWAALPDRAPAFPRARAPSGVVAGAAPHARAVGHTLALADADGVIRRAPLFVRASDRAVPALGLALAPAFADAAPDRIAFGPSAVALGGSPGPRIPVDTGGHILLGAGGGATAVVPFLDVLEPIEAGHTERIRQLVDGRIVLVVAEPRPGGAAGPTGLPPEMAVQLRLLDTVLGGTWSRQIPEGWALAGAVALGSLGAWLCLALPWWLGAGAVAALAGGHVAAVLLLLSGAGVVLPAWPLAALALAAAAALVWTRLGATRRRIATLEDRVRVARDALARRESAVDALEEDLEAARSGAERELRETADALRAQLAEARAQEEQARRRLGELEAATRQARAAEPRPGAQAEGEQARAQACCERLGIVTRDAAVLAAFHDLARAARSSLPVLIAGEPGTGKELFARAVHRLGPRAAGPFVAVSMAAIPPDLFESEMFGHVRGAFTGAGADRRGHLAQADGGTLFLDEVGELRPDHQAKLLRALQEQSFHPVGATRPAAVDVRVVSASNRDLQRGVEEGWFRKDLYFRLRGFLLELPPLRARPGDIPLLATRFLESAAAGDGRQGLALSEAALAALERHDWPGNVRELQHCIARAVALADGPLITPHDLRLPVPVGASAPGPSTGPATRASGSTAAAPGAVPLAHGSEGGRPETARSPEDDRVLTALRQHGFDMQATARALGCDRSTVTQRLKGLGFLALVEAGGDHARAAAALAGDPGIARTVELKLRDYHAHLLGVVEGFRAPDEAVAACRRRFKNLPERHFRSLETLVRRHLERPSAAPQPRRVGGP